MNKEVDLLKIALQLGVARLGASAALEEAWHKLPEKEGGFPTVMSDFVGLGLELIDDEILPAIAQYTGGEIDVDNLPVPEPEPEPDPMPDGSDNVIRIMNTGKTMSWYGYPYDKFVFPRVGPDYTDEPFDLVFEDGKKLHVPNPEKMYMKYPENMKYQPGGQYSNHNPDIPTMEVYAWKDTHPDWVEARFRHPVDTTVPDKPPGGGVDTSGWTRIVWNGNPNETSEGRSRLWWTKIHGGSESRWWRKFPLPVWLDDKSYQVDFRFSSGKTFYVPNSMKMAMEDDDGPKYRHQDGNQEPDKQHPKISEEYGRNETWVEFKIR